MNLLPPYEQTIADRQAGIEIPDMADAIWGRVAAALDVEMPVNDTPATSGNAFFKNPAVWIISAGILAIIIALFLLLRNSIPVPAPPRDLPQPATPTLKPDTIMTQHFKPPDLPKKNTSIINKKQVADTTAHSTFPQVTTDSLLKASPVITMPPAIKIQPPAITEPSIDIKQRPTKYGVVVSDSDYKFKVKPKE